MQKNGFEVLGGLLPRDLAKHEWSALSNELLAAEVDVWVLAARKADLEDPVVRYSLSCALSSVRAMREQPLQEILVGLDHKPDPETLPTLLRSCHMIDGSSGRWGASCTIAVHGGKKGLPPQDEWRFQVIAHQFVGQWYEVGPVEGTWEGAMVGFAGENVSIEMHGVGKKAEIPERTVHNYALEGVKAEIGGTEFVANALKNPVSAEEGYFLKVRGNPTRVFVGPYPGEEETDQEAWILDMQ